MAVRPLAPTLDDSLWLLAAFVLVAVALALSRSSSLAASAARAKADALLASCAILVTGGAQGIGLALATELADARRPVVLLDVDAAALAAAVDALKRRYGADARVLAMRCDVSSAAEVRSAVAQAREGLRGTPIGVVVSNAAVVCCRDADQLSAEDVARTLAVNVGAHFNLLRELLPEMKARRAGCFVAVGSVMGLVGSARLSLYCTSKFALNGLVESLRLELGRDGLATDVSTVLSAPYAVSTGLFEGIFTSPRDVGSWLRTLVARELEPAEVAREIAARVRAGGHHAFTVPTHVGGLLSGMSALLPLATRDAVAGYLGGWFGAEGFVGRRIPAPDFAQSRPPLRPEPAFAPQQRAQPFELPQPQQPQPPPTQPLQLRPEQAPLQLEQLAAVRAAEQPPPPVSLAGAAPAAAGVGLSRRRSFGLRTH